MTATCTQTASKDEVNLVALGRSKNGLCKLNPNSAIFPKHKPVWPGHTTEVAITTVGMNNYIHKKSNWNCVVETDEAVCRQHETVILWCHFQQCPLRLVLHEKKWWDRGFTVRPKKAWPCLGLAAEWHWLAVGGSSLSLAWMGWAQVG